MKRIATRLVLVAVAAAALVPSAGAQTTPPGASQQAPDERPNVLLIVTDDQASSVFSRELMPNLFERVVDRGVLFERGYVGTSQCCPSRAQILTGLMGHHTGVDGNRVPLGHPTMVEMLKDVGYQTMLAGKYLNSWPCKTPRPEFDRWICIQGENSHASLQDPSLFVEGNTKHFEGYQTEVLADKVGRFLDKTPAEQPVFVMYTPTSPHMPADDDRFASLEVPEYRPPNFDLISGGELPPYAQRDPLTAEEIDHIDRTYRRMTRSTRGLDESIGHVLDSFGPRLENTLIVFLSDNGYMYGEHRLMKKIAPYEESMRVPFAVAYPGLAGARVSASTTSLVQNIDIAPTIAEAVDRPWVADGTSLLPLLIAPQINIHDALLLENCQAVSYPCGGTAPRGSRKIPSFWGLVNDRYKYVEYSTGHQELYDLSRDPYELLNIVNDPLQAGLADAFHRRILAMRAEPPVETVIVSGPQSPVADDIVTFRYTTQSRHSTFLCRLYPAGGEADWQPCLRWGQSFGPLAPGDYVFEVAAQDVSKKLDSSPAARAFSVVSSTSP